MITARQLLYADFAAATPLDERVFAAMQPYFSEQFFNPSSSYQAAKEVRQALEAARARVAHWIGAKPAEIIFTAGATESINLAIHGLLGQAPNAHIVTTAIEHDAVLAAAKLHNHTIVGVDRHGNVDTQALAKAIQDTTVLVSVGYANNEIGTVQSLKIVAECVEKVRALRRLKNNHVPLYVHTDASQAACYLDVHASRLGADLLTLNGGKIYGPKQTGILYVKAGVRLAPQVVGGGQEMGLRSGTENVAGSIGLATALDIAQSERKQAVDYMRTIRSELQRRLTAEIPDLIINGNPKKCVPHILHVSREGIDGERLVMWLDEQGLMASTGSACAANKQTASHVLQAIGASDAAIAGSLRLSLGRFTTTADVARIAELVIKGLRALRAKE